MSWSYAYTAVRGASHIRQGTRIQDAIKCFEVDSAIGRQLAGVICDGAGSAEFGGQGAALVCRFLTTRIRTAVGKSAELPSDDEVWSWVDDARDAIQQAALRRERRGRDFASTLVMFIASPGGVLTAHIGDGAIVGRKKESGIWQTLSSPQSGEYASTTFFVTDDPSPSLRIARHDEPFDGLAAFSDGIEGLVLDGVTKEPSPAFFNPMLRPLLASAKEGRRSDLTARLGQFLQTDRVLERTDDDISLVVAVNQ